MASTGPSTPPTSTGPATALSMRRIIAEDVVPALTHTMRLLGAHSATLLWGAVGIIAPPPKPLPLLPPSGLDEGAAQALWCALQQAAACHAHAHAEVVHAQAEPRLLQDMQTPSPAGGSGAAAAAAAAGADEEGVERLAQLQLLQAPGEWLQALQAARAASDRLLLDMQAVSGALAFWQRQLRAGSGSEGAHARFLLLQRGPLAFLRSLAGLLARLVDALLTPGSWLLPPPTFNQPRLAQPASPSGAPGLTGPAGAAAAPDAAWGATWATDAWELALSSTNQVQQRVLLLQQLRRQLAAALAQVHRAAAALWLLPAGPPASVSLLAPGLAQLAHSTAPPLPSDIAAAAAAATAAAATTCGDAEPTAATAAAVAPGAARLQRGPVGAAAAAAHSAVLLRCASAAARSCAVGVRCALLDAQASTSWLQRCTPPTLAPAHRLPTTAAAAAPPSLRTTPLAQGNTWYIRGLAALSRLLHPSAPQDDVGGGSFSVGLHQAPPLPLAAFGLTPGDQGPIVDILLGRDGAGEDTQGTLGEVLKKEEQQQQQEEQPQPQQQQQQGSVAGALRSAQAAACGAPALVSLPPWLRAPSSLQRYWLSHLLRAGAAAWALRFLYRHSRLSGSDDLERWAGEAAQAVAGAWTAHVAEPLANVRAELFHTFRDRPSIVTQAEFEADQQSLARMLHDFAKDKGVPAAAAGTVAAMATVAGGDGVAGAPLSPSTPINAPPAGSAPLANVVAPGSTSVASGPGAASSASAAAPAAAAPVPSPTTAPVAGGTPTSGGSGGGVPVATQADLAGGMQLVMRSYEEELRNPLRNLVIGDLARAMLIQVQRLKLDTEAAMLQLDQILRASELSISLMAALPALLLSWAALAGVVRWLTPRAPDVKRDAVPLRMAGADAARALQALLRQQQRQQREQGEQRVQEQGQAMAPAFPGGTASLSEEGMVLYRLSCMYLETERLYRHYDRTSQRSEYPHLVADLLLLARLAVDPQGEGASDMAPVLQQLLRTYRAFQQPA